MLDQNTDRMWYVIGAVLVGAAIILIANGTLPQMFASVTDSFEGLVDEVSGFSSDTKDISEQEWVNGMYDITYSANSPEGKVTFSLWDVYPSVYTTVDAIPVEDVKSITIELHEELNESAQSMNLVHMYDAEMNNLHFDNGFLYASFIPQTNPDYVEGYYFQHSYERKQYLDENPDLSLGESVDYQLESIAYMEPFLLELLEGHIQPYIRTIDLAEGTEYIRLQLEQGSTADYTITLNY